MESVKDQLDIILGLLYACGAIIELLVQLSHEQGIPHDLPERLQRKPYLAALRPLVFVVLPILLWPLMMVYRICRPLVEVSRECLLQADDFVDYEAEFPASSESQERIVGADGDGDGDGDDDADLEKQAVIGTVVPPASSGGPRPEPSSSAGYQMTPAMGDWVSAAPAGREESLPE